MQVQPLSLKLVASELDKVAAQILSTSGAWHNRTYVSAATHKQRHTYNMESCPTSTFGGDLIRLNRTSSSDKFRRCLRSADVDTCIAPRTETRLSGRSFSAAGPRLWNSLPSDLRRPDTELGEFRRLLKTYLFGFS